MTEAELRAVGDRIMSQKIQVAPGSHKKCRKRLSSKHPEAISPFDTLTLAQGDLFCTSDFQNGKVIRSHCFMS